MNDKPIGRKTSPGFADPHAPVRLGQAIPVHPVAASPQIAAHPQALPAAPSAPARSATRPPGAGPSSWPRAVRTSKPLIEVEVVRERSRSPRADAQSGCYEIWTQNHVYAVDARMRCTEVREVATGARKADHPFLASRLVGGQAQEHAMEMSHPLPRPGSCAVFEMRKGNRRHFTRTSVVERVVLRMRIVTIADGTDVPSWDQLVAEDDE
jgi:hypothetical protein